MTAAFTPDPPCTCDGNGFVTCWACGGAGGFHNCGDDCCPHLHPEEDLTDCSTCEGTGEIRCAGCATGAPEETNDGR